MVVITQKERRMDAWSLASRQNDTILLVLTKFKGFSEGFQALSLSMSCILRKQLSISLPFLYLSAKGYTFKDSPACLSTFIIPLSMVSLGELMVAATPHFPSLHSKTLTQNLVFWKVEAANLTLVNLSMRVNLQVRLCIIMGASHQRTSEAWITIQRNTKNPNTQLFDFTKDRVVLNSSKLFSPSYLHYYDQQKTVTYSLLQDHQNQFAHLGWSESNEGVVCLRVVNGAVSGRIWRMLRESEEVELEEGSFIKLGRVELEVKELVFANHKKSVRSLIIQQEEEEASRLVVRQPYLNPLANSNFLKCSEVSRFSRLKDSDILSLSPSNHLLKNSIFTQRSSNEPFCRFCFDGSSSKRNPLFSVCRCTGSVKSIHFQCLKNWVRSKTNKVETSHCVYYHYEPLTCEICREVIRNEILHQGMVYRLFQPEKIHPPYARFQHFQDGRVFVIILRLEEASTINIGRGPENQLSLNDQTISRAHSSLFYTSRKLFLKGKPSKYGTLIQLSKPIQFYPNRPIELLIQNNLLTLSRKPQERGLFDQQCCRPDNVFKLVLE